MKLKSEEQMRIIKIIQFVKEYIKYMTIEQVMNNENFDKELDVIVINISQ